MSKMRSDRRPPLAKSPLRLRPRRVLQTNSSTTVQTPPGSLTKSQKMNRPWDFEESEVRPEYQTISCELRALAKMVRIEFGSDETENNGAGISISNPVKAKSKSLFERGRFYDEYSARRNERLKRKKAETVVEHMHKTPYNLGVTVESSKRCGSKKLESLRKSVSAAYSVGRSEATPTPRYMLRSMSKENKKPPMPLPLPLGVNLEKSMVAGGRRIGTRSVRRI